MESKRNLDFHPFEEESEKYKGKSVPDINGVPEAVQKYYLLRHLYSLGGKHLIAEHYLLEKLND